MKPPDEVRRWVSEMMGMAFRADDLAESLGAWEILGRALTAVHGAAVPVERPHEPEG
jgi:hypothetical protein